MTPHLTADKALLSATVAVLILSAIIAFISPAYFGQSFAVEDGPIEYGTAIFLLISSIALASNATVLRQPHRYLKVLTLIYALMFFLAAGEEISWGQRIFGWESSEYFREHNFQDETNLHNLVVGDVHLAKIVFGHALSIAVFLYLVIIPILNTRFTFPERVFNAISLPMPGIRHAVLTLSATLIVSGIEAPRKWEVYELVFAFLSLSIFLNPSNAIYAGRCGLPSHCAKLPAE